MALPIIAYLGYAGAAAALGFLVSSCDSEEKKSESPHPSPSASTTPPTPPKTKVEIDPKSAVYMLYEELKKAGLTDEQIDTVKRDPERECLYRDACLMDLGGPAPGVSFKTQSIGMDPGEKDGRITQYDLIHTATYFFKKELSEEENKKWQDKFKITFKRIGYWFYNEGALQSGNHPPNPPQACQGLTSFQKALFWGLEHPQAHFILGICKTDPLHLFQAIQVDPGFQEAKVALEEFYREKNQKDPKDPVPWMNLGYALKAQGRLKEAVACYQEVLKQNPKMPTAHLELRDIFRTQGRLAEAHRHGKLALPEECLSSGLPPVRGVDGPPLLGKTPAEKAKSYVPWSLPYTQEWKQRDEEFWDHCRNAGDKLK